MFRLSSFLLLSAILLMGCSSMDRSYFSTTDKQVTASELGQYWIVKDGILDWSELFEEQDASGDFTASFKINDQGEIQQITLTDISDSLKNSAINVEPFSRQCFISAKDNYSNQPVSVTARIELNL